MLIRQQQFVAECACVQDVEQDLLSLGMGCLAAPLSLFILRLALSQFFLQADGLSPHGFESFTLLGEIKLISRSLQFQLLKLLLDFQHFFRSGRKAGFQVMQ